MPWEEIPEPGKVPTIDNGELDQRIQNQLGDVVGDDLTQPIVIKTRKDLFRAAYTAILIHAPEMSPLQRKMIAKKVQRGQITIDQVQGMISKVVEMRKDGTITM